MMFRPAIIFLRLCHGTVLTALRGVHRFTSAQATIFIATKQPVFHTGERQHVSTAGSLDPLCGEAAQRIRSARYCFRSSPPPCRIAMRREVSFHSLPRSRLRRSMICSALFHDRAFLIIMKYSCSSHKSICSFPYEIPQDCTCVHA